MAKLEAYPWVPSEAVINQHSSAPIKKLLGCGMWGCVFLLKNNTVLKVTSDNSEVTGMTLVKSLRDERVAPLHGIVDILSDPKRIGPFPWKDKSRGDIFVYERELVVPLMAEDADRFDFGLPLRSRFGGDYESDGDAILQMNRFGVDLIQNRFNPLTKKTKAQRTKREKGFLKGYLDSFEDLVEDVKSLARCEPNPDIVNLQPIVDSLDTIIERNYVILDIGPNNMGMSREGYPKLFDFELIEVS